MCHFPSWFETKRGDVLFVTNEDVLASPKSIEEIDDRAGHGFIRSKRAKQFKMLMDSGNFPRQYEVDIDHGARPQRINKKVLLHILRGKMYLVGFSTTMLNEAGKDRWRELRSKAFGEIQTTYRVNSRMSDRRLRAYRADLEIADGTCFWKVFKHDKYKSTTWRHLAEKYKGARL